MTTYWLIFHDQEAEPSERFRGVSIFDMEGTKRKADVVEEARRLMAKREGGNDATPLRRYSDLHHNSRLVCRSKDAQQR